MHDSSLYACSIIFNNELIQVAKNEPSWNHCMQEKFDYTPGVTVENYVNKLNYQLIPECCSMNVCLVVGNTTIVIPRIVNKPFDGNYIETNNSNIFAYISCTTKNVTNF